MTSGMTGGYATTYLKYMTGLIWTEPDLSISRQSVLKAIEYLKVEKKLTSAEKSEYKKILDEMLQDTEDNDLCQYYCH